MTLEDFFTKTEMNNGLTAPSRVRELIAVMQKEKGPIVNNSAESSRKWSAVAGAIAATENKECLDLFIQLDGLRFISEWMKDAQKFCNEIDGFAEDTVANLLRALEKPHLEYDKVVASEIWATVQDLRVHSSLKVRNEAQALFEIWTMNRDCAASISDVENSRSITDDEAAKSTDPVKGVTHMETTVGSDASSKETSKEKSRKMTGDREILSKNCDAVHTSQLGSAQNSETLLDSAVMKQASDEIGSPPLPRSSVEPYCHHVGTAIEPCSPAVSKLALDTLTGTNQSKSPSYEERFPKTGKSPPKSSLVEESKPAEDKNSTSSEVFSEMQLAADASPLKTSVAEEQSSCNVQLSHTEDLGTSGSKDDKTSTPDPKKSDLVGHYDLSINKMSKKPDRAAEKSSLEIDYGIIDPLEFARQVAIEVKRDIVDCGEQSGGSSEKIPENNVEQPENPDYMSGKQLSHASEGSREQEASDPDLFAGSSSMHQNSASSLENVSSQQTNNRIDMVNSEIGDSVQAEANPVKGPHDFDLNEKFPSEDADHPGSEHLVSISTVTSSTAAPPAPPSASLQFEGNLGWKGSAATSAFRQASPRQMLENDAGPSSQRAGSSSSKQQVCLEIDLNADEGAGAGEGGPSGESSVEMKRRRSEHLELDLNCASDDGGTPSDWQIQQLFPHGNHSNSSSSSKQPARNINLNDQPSFPNNSSDNCHLSIASQNQIKSGDSVISIMGTRVEVNRKDFVSPTPSISNGRTSELTFDANLGSTGGGFLGIGSPIPYTHSPLYGGNNMAPTPVMPYSSPIYGSAAPFLPPYMVDSRGAPVIPQLVGSASAMPAGFSQPPFVVNMNGFAPPPNGGIRPLQSSFDVNSGMLLESGGSKDPPGFGLFLNSTQVQSVDERLRSYSQPTVNPALGGKRKEPENGWENYPFRPYMPPWRNT
ncbi:uncharacterized protein LOC127246625 [Andrographis paniculata]|uniref:uncharacterized protein LOC127246625 n=1 Tax=Andrographis paniculata TaxID=175694 RepID=UPI0021E738D3|nr:uncharacterized protein LOC127246625 [Andrographis paniculata]XP_051124054.1 uncharacterized protein LOC127246625 [Andrographis paniculata]